MSFAPHFVVVFVISESKYIGIRSFKAIEGISLSEVYFVIGSPRGVRHGFQDQTTLFVVHVDYVSNDVFPSLWRNDIIMTIIRCSSSSK